MARRPREDAAGACFHVFNRGIARRTLFEQAGDMIVFMEHLAAASERGEIQVLAFTLLTTHYHLMLCSPGGVLASGMQRMQTEYSRYFNRTRRRDGPLVRGRYASKRVRSEFYRRTLVRYIDRNPVEAGLVERAVDHRYGSARAYELDRENLYPWLERSWVEAEVCRRLGLTNYDGARYPEVFGKLPERLARLVEARLRSRDDEDPLEHLIDAAPEVVLDWMQRKASLADGTRPGLPVAAPECVAEAVAELARADGAWQLGRRDGWKVLRTGLLRQLCGLALDEIGRREDCSVTAVHRICALHQSLLQSDASYATLATGATRLALETWK